MADGDNGKRCQLANQFGTKVIGPGSSCCVAVLSDGRRPSVLLYVPVAYLRWLRESVEPLVPATIIVPIKLWTRFFMGQSFQA